MIMFTLDSTTHEVLSHPEFVAPMGCRAKARAVAWGPDTFRDFLARPRQMAITDAAQQMLRQIPHLLDPELQAALENYLEGGHA
jgi:hypothetical protein